MEELKIVKTNINIGIEKPFKILHITDSHLCLAYEEEGEFLNNLKKKRAINAFGGEHVQEKYLDLALDYAQKNCDLIAYTGDIYDYLSLENFDYLDKILSKMDYIYCAGNHDFCTAPGRDKEDYDFKMNQMKIVQKHINDNLIFSSRIINGVNLITLDNSYYQFTSGQYDMLRCEVDKGYPIILFTHTPIYSKESANISMQNGDCAYVVCPPEELLMQYPKERAEYQRANEATRKMVDYIKNEEKIICIFTGHVHRNYEEEISNGKMQYITGGTFLGDVREITIH